MPPSDGAGGPGILDTETALVARARAGDVDAFEQLAGAHADRLFAVLLRLLGDRAEAEDVAQEVMLRAWRGKSGFLGQSLFFTWLYRIAINEANRSLGKRSRTPGWTSIDDAVVQLPAAAREEPSRRLEQAELREALSQALVRLPPDYRIAVVLHDVEGLSARQAAEVAGCGEAAFKSRLHQARLRIRAAIGDDALINAGS
jgi:RNA polymerase sigma-70 factor (ECF subfamily)